MKNQQRTATALMGILLSFGLFGLAHSTVAAEGYSPVNQVSDIAGVARRPDPNLVNPWGIVFTATGKIWVSDNGTGVSTIYSPGGTPQSLVVTIPTPPADTNPAAPTGVVLNNSSDFVVSGVHTSGPSIFIFATEDGTVAGWNPAANPTNAILIVDNSMSGTGAVYKGIALGEDGSSNFVYVTNFRSGFVEMYDAHFHFVGSFTDPAVETNGFAPFGIQNVGGKLLVTFARQNDAKHDDVAGAGSGFVDVFTTGGAFVKQLVAHGALNSPWGIAPAPKGFGKFGGALLVGNFGDGTINAFNPTNGVPLGTLSFPEGDPIVINALWGLTFGIKLTVHDDPGDRDRDRENVLYFTAGIADESHGLLGFIRKAKSTDFR